MNINLKQQNLKSFFYSFFIKIDVKDNRFSSSDEELNKIVGNIQDIKMENL